MRKKIIVIFVCMLLNITIITTVSNAKTLIKRPIEKQFIYGDNTSKIDVDESNIIESTSKSNGDTLDQYNTVFSNWLLSIRLPFWRAQGFTASLGVLTRVELYLLRVGNPPQGTEITVSIRNTLNGTNLTEVTIDPAFMGNDMEWVEFNFTDIGVNLGEKYYIIMSSNADNLSNCYYCGFGINNPYTNGDSWGSNDSGLTWVLHNDTRFEEFPWLDFCFKTYGFANSAPNDPLIIGPVKGQANTDYDYKISSTDPENNEIIYVVDWGDNTGLVDYGPYESGLEIIKTYNWNQEGTYDIKVKAKDIYGAESDWAALSVSMPRNRAMQMPFLKLLEQHPILYQLFQRFLQI